MPGTFQTCLIRDNLNFLQRLLKSRLPAVLSITRLQYHAELQMLRKGTR